MSRGSLTDRVRAVALRTLLLALAVAGGGTAVVLHVAALRTLDQALAAAAAEATGTVVTGWHVHLPRVSMTVEPWDADNPLVEAALAEAVLEDEQPRFVNRAGRRALVVVVEPEHALVGGGLTLPDEEHEHRLVVASAPYPSWFDTAGTFVLAWLIIASLVAWGAAGWLRLRVADAMGPLGRVAEALDQALGEGRGSRLRPEGVVEVDQVVAAANALFDRLEAAFTAQSRFTAEAAHELRTPVTVLLGEIELARRRPRSGEEHSAILGRLQIEAVRLKERVEALMALARVDAGQAQITREREHPSALLHAALADEQRALEAAGCRVEVEVGPDPEVEVHAGLVQLAIANLLRNAARHAPGSLVRLTTEAADWTVRIVVQDDGPGIAAPDLERVFERFARRGGDGLGLGLPLAREIARRHGGDVVVEGGAGCRMVLTLPVRAAHPSLLRA